MFITRYPAPIGVDPIYDKVRLTPLLLVVFVSDFSGVFAILPCFVECNPYTLDSHGVGCLALLLNLALLPAPS